MTSYGGKLGGFGGPPRYGGYIGGNAPPEMGGGVVWELCHLIKFSLSRVVKTNVNCQDVTKNFRIDIKICNL